MHPAEVPLVPEAQTAHILGRETPGKSVDSSAIVTAPETAHQEYGWYYARIQSLQDSRPAKFVRDPLPLFTAVVAINHDATASTRSASIPKRSIQ